MSIGGGVDVQIGRAEWEPIQAIPDIRFQRILAQHVQCSAHPEITRYKYVEHFQGAYNHVRIFKDTSGENVESYAVKVPGVGTAARWQKQDADMLRSEYGTMRLIQEKTRCPVPEVIAYNDTLENELGAPFIIMKTCPGVTANQIWFDATIDEQGKVKDDVQNVDSPSEDRKVMRKNFLESLARAMAELQMLQFDKIGALHFKNPQSDLSYQTDQVLKEQFMCGSSHAFFESAFRDKYSDSPYKVQSERIIDQILGALYRCAPFTTSYRSGETKKTFVLRHDDLGFRNILCDKKTGEVTAIVDWERCVTAPRCIGFASLPTFLILDWFPSSSYPSPTKQDKMLNRYRQTYAEAMLAATGLKGDGKYTTKSALYQAAYATIHGSAIGEDRNRLVQRVLGLIPSLPDLRHDRWLSWLEENWEEYGDDVKGSLAQVATPSAISANEQ